MNAWLYTRSGCAACATARSWLAARGYDVTEVAVDNPLTELGVGMFFNDRQPHVPVFVLPLDGVYMLSADGRTPLRLLSLVPDERETAPEEARRPC